MKRSTITKKLCRSVLAVGLVLSILISIIIYPIIYNVLKENAVSNVRQISEQATARIDRAIEQFEMYSRFIGGDEYLYQLLNRYEQKQDTALHEQIRTAITGYLNFFPNIASCMVLLEDGRSFGDISCAMESNRIKNSDWYRDYKQNGYSRHFSGLVNYDGSIPPEGETGVYLCLVYPYQNKSMKGDLVFTVPFSVIEDAFGVFYENGFDLILFGRNNMPIFKRYDGIETHLDVSHIRSMMEQPGIKSILESENRYGVDMVAYTQLGGWKLALHVPNEYIIGYFQSTFYLLYGMQLVMVVVFILSLVLLISKRLRPLRAVSRQMNRVTEDNLDVQIDIRTGDELEELSESFNYMLKRIQSSVQEQIEHERAEKQMEYALMAAQVDPHFIYKTLGVVTYLAEQGENKRLIDVNAALVDILQDRLRISKIDVFDTVQREIEMVESYLTIQRVRYSDSIHFEKQTDDGALSQLIPKNILQPLIENAVFHGVLLNVDEEMRILGGTVRLTAEMQEDGLVIQVADNGPGMAQEAVKRYFERDIGPGEEKGKHIGIRNIRRRLDYLYGEDYSMQALSSPGIGTKITLYLGKRRERNEKI